MYNYEWSQEELWELRQEVTPGSIYTRDYENSFGVPTSECYYFFDSYLEELGYLMGEEIDGYDDSQYWDYIEDYDNPENLYEYWYGIEYPNLNPVGKLVLEYLSDNDLPSQIDADVYTDAFQTNTSVEDWEATIRGLEDVLTNIRDYDSDMEDATDEELATYESEVRKLINYIKKLITT